MMSRNFSKPGHESDHNAGTGQNSTRGRISYANSLRPSTNRRVHGVSNSKMRKIQVTLRVNPSRGRLFSPAMAIVALISIALLVTPVEAGKGKCDNWRACGNEQLDQNVKKCISPDGRVCLYYGDMKLCKRCRQTQKKITLGKATYCWIHTTRLNKERIPIPYRFRNNVRYVLENGVPDHGRSIIEARERAKGDKPRNGVRPQLLGATSQSSPRLMRQVTPTPIPVVTPEPVNPRATPVASPFAPPEGASADEKRETAVDSGLAANAGGKAVPSQFAPQEWDAQRTPQRPKKAIFLLL